MQRPVDSDGGGDHQMTGMLSSIPPSISLTRPIGFTTMLQNHQHNNNLIFDPMLTTSNSNDNVSNLLPAKRSLPGNFFFTDETHTKRFFSDGDGGVTTEESGGVFRQPFVGDGVFRQPYTLPAMNWY